ncbi:MAG: dihydrolipoyl dehydrogenase [Acidobacteriia bacterium]|nr:dihydrolipoyl dehydrogenase [Terriglobia bacterium]
METFSVVVIGAGPGGYPAAIRAAQLGASVALVEKEELGGTCLNWGCIPTKTLIASSDLYAQMKSCQDLGLSAEKVSFDYRAMVGRKDRTVQTLRTGVQQLLAANGVKVFKGTASFEGRNRIVVNSQQSPGGSPTTVIGAERTIIATGAASAMPDFLPRHERVVESRAFLDLKLLPSRVLVLGGGLIGCEFACMLAQLDVRVTVVELLEDILWTLDADVRRTVRQHMEQALGIRVITGTSLSNLVPDDRQVRAQAGQEWLEADLLLAALGRKPVTAALHLANAGLTANSQGFIEVDEYGRTQVATVYAIGDVTGGVQLAHAATSQGLTAAENACNRRLRKNEKAVPVCIFTSPEIGTVGLSEREAREKDLEIKTGKYRFAALGKGLALGHAPGFVKWIADASTDQLLGAQAVGPHATELIAEATAAIRAELTAEELADTTHAHPTLSEAWLEAAHVLVGKPLHFAPKKKI